MQTPAKQTEKQASKTTTTNGTFFGGGGAVPFFQAKLTVNEPGDVYEQEADHIADLIMRMKSDDPPMLQRMPFSPISTVQRMCADCEKEDIQRNETHNGDAGGKSAPSTVSDVLSSGGGQSMDIGALRFMEDRFGQNFSQVRIHTDALAAESAAAIQARAYTSGRDVVFGAGEYQPSSENGRRLLAHELVHVQQQGEGQIRLQRTPWPLDSSEYVQNAIKFINNKEVSMKMNEAWTQSSPGTDDAKEWSGALVERGTDQLALNVKPGKGGHSKPQIRGGEINKETDQVKGDFHTHPYNPKDIKKVTGAYNWDGQGLGPSGGDFESLKGERTGYFMAMESGTIRYLIVVNDAYKFKKYAYQNLEKAIDDEADKSVLTRDNMERNPDAKTPMSHQAAHLQGVVNALNQMKADKGTDDIGITLLKTTDKEKTKYEKVF